MNRRLMKVSGLCALFGSAFRIQQPRIVRMEYRGTVLDGELIRVDNTGFMIRSCVGMQFDELVSLAEQSQLGPLRHFEQSAASNQVHVKAVWHLRNLYGQKS